MIFITDGCEGILTYSELSNTAHGPGATGVANSETTEDGCRQSCSEAGVAGCQSYEFNPTTKVCTLFATADDPATRVTGAGVYGYWTCEEEQNCVPYSKAVFDSAANFAAVEDFELRIFTSHRFVIAGEVKSWTFYTLTTGMLYNL